MEIYIKIELLDAAGEMAAERTVNGDTDEPGLMGDIEAALDELREEQEWLEEE